MTRMGWVSASSLASDFVVQQRPKRGGSDGRTGGTRGPQRAGCVLDATERRRRRGDESLIGIPHSALRIPDWLETPHVVSYEA